MPETWWSRGGRAGARRDNDCIRGIAIGLRCIYMLIPWLLKLLVVDLLLSALLPLSLVLPDQCYDLASRLAEWIWRSIQRIFTHANGAEITLSGDHDLPRDESAIVISNHLAWADFYMIQQLADNSGMLGRCRWFAKAQLKWVPFLGWGLWAMGMPLVSRSWTRDQKEVDRVFKGVVKREWPIWLIAYSEGTRYTPAKRLEAEKWCKAHNKRLGKHLLYPRTKGFVKSVQELRTTPHVEAVYDVTIAYAKDDHLFQEAPPFRQTLTLPHLSEHWRFFVHVTRHPLSKLPDSDEGLAQWLEDRWVEKGERLETLRRELEGGQSWQAMHDTEVSLLD